MKIGSDCRRIFEEQLGRAMLGHGAGQQLQKHMGAAKPLIVFKEEHKITTMSSLMYILLVFFDARQVKTY